MSRRLRVVERELWTPPRAEINIHNKFHLELFKAKNGKKLTEAWAENVVTNAGRTKCANNGVFDNLDFMGACALGTGTNAPSPTDITMGANLKSVAGTATSAQIANPTAYSIAVGDWWRRQKFYFPELIANYSLTEVGLFTGSTNSASTVGPGKASNNTTLLSASTPLSTRALFRDANGDPISVTKTNTQIMVITATVYLTRGGVDSGMRLLDNFFARQMDEGGLTPGANNVNYSGWLLGNGNTPPANNDTALSGVQQAAKADPTNTGLTRKNRVFWSSVGWYYPAFTNDRPGEKPYTSSYTQDWDLNEGNVTFSEVLIRLQGFSGTVSTNASQSAIRIVFPCGTVGSSSVTKDNTQKLRQYVELSW